MTTLNSHLKLLEIFTDSIYFTRTHKHKYVTFSIFVFFYMKQYQPF